MPPTPEMIAEVTGADKPLEIKKLVKPKNKIFDSHTDLLELLSRINAVDRRVSVYLF